MSTTHPWITLCRAALLAAGIAGLSAPTPAWAHAFIEHAEPPVGGLVRQPPAEVRLSFTEEVEAGFSSVKVFDAAGKEIDKRDLHADPKNARRLCVSLPASLGAGTYKVAWRVVSADTHVTQGEFTFRVEP